MNRVSRFFSDVQEPRVYNTTLPPQEAVYSGQQQIYGAARAPMPEARGPWWAQGVMEGPQTTQVTTQYSGNVRMGQTNQLSPQDQALYDRYLSVDRPHDLVVEGDRYTQSNGRLRKMDYSGRWRQVGDPYYYTEQQQQQVAYAAPVQRSYVQEEVGYSPYGYQAVVPAAMGRQMITETVQAPMERRIMSGRAY